MPIDTKIRYADVGRLFLDPKNPRIGRRNSSTELAPEKILDLMREWELDELAVSFLESGFWPHEALLVVEEKIYGRIQLVVVEGNRRLAALKMLERAKDGHPTSEKWRQLVEEYTVPDELLTKVPYLLLSSRKDVSAFLGFRHVTGIKEWRPAEKAEYIAHLIDSEGLDYQTVRKKIGSKAPTVRRNYIAYRLLLQMEAREDIDIEKVEEKFSVLFLSIRTVGVQKYLHIDLEAEPGKAKRPVPRTHLKNLERFALWLFGDSKHPPVISDSRYVEKFASLLESKEAIRYLEKTDKPSFETALKISGGDEIDVLSSIQQAGDFARLALSSAHQFRRSSKVQKALEVFGRDALQLLGVFPAIRTRLIEESVDAGAA
jgi:hypothetical protein